MNAVQITHITKDYGNSKGIFDVSLSVKKGEVYGFLGPNGAGKTTTIRHLLGFLKPEKGECLINGMDCFCQASLIQKNLGYLAGEIAFPEDFTGHGLLHFLADMKGIRDRSVDKGAEDEDAEPAGQSRKEEDPDGVVEVEVPDFQDVAGNQAAAEKGGDKHIEGEKAADFQPLMY